MIKEEKALPACDLLTYFYGNQQVHIHVQGKEGKLVVLRRREYVKKYS